MSDPLRLNETNLITLLAILRLGDEAYGVTLCKEITAISGTSAALASVYKALERLEKSGLITSHMSQPSAVRGGRAKRFVQVTHKGLRAIDETRTTLSSLWREVPAYTKTVRTEKTR